MGQIFDRLKRITSSYFTDVSFAERIIDSQDDELKRIIDELNNPKTKDETKFEYNNHYQKKDDTIPQNVREAFNIIGLNVFSDINTIKSTFKQKIKEHHPDKFQKSDEQTRKIAQKKSQDLINAYNVIKAYKGF